MSAWIEIWGRFELLSLKQSHSTWVRGLKYVSFVIPTQTTQVALYMSAWIEIKLKTLKESKGLSRTLHECVDWNPKNDYRKHSTHTSHSTWVRGLKFAHQMRVVAVLIGRTLHECVDWNKFDTSEVASAMVSHSTWVRGLKFWFCCTFVETWKVALYMSAWIEMMKFTPIHMILLVALYMSAWIEILIFDGRWLSNSCRTLHECVDWNFAR